MFRISFDQDSVSSIALPSDIAVLIGRSDSCHVRVKDLSASRVHCRVISHDGRVTLYDAGSRWGTFVNGKRVFAECVLLPGDQVQIGSTSLQLIQVQQ